MPWDAKSFARHNHALHGESAAKAASIANAILKRTGDEGLAIATANKRSRADGGSTLKETLSELEGRNDVGYIRRQSVDPGALQQEIIRKYNLGPTGHRDAEDYAYSLRSYENAVNTEAPGPRADGGTTPDIDHAIRIARRDVGGYTPPSPPYFERGAMHNVAEAHPYGFTAGTGGGRTDKNDVSLGSGSYVLPADVVAGLGDGNSLAGAHVWNTILGSMPYGVTPPKMVGHRGPPNPPHDAALMQGITGGGQQEHLAEGGQADEVPIKSADGEVLVSPEDVTRIGHFYAPDRERGDPAAMMRRGHRILDSFVKRTRGDTIRHLRSLKGPVGSKDASKGHV